MNTQIFNRWGRKITQSDDLDIKWEGMDENDQISPDGVYYWIARYSDIEGNAYIQKGYLNLRR